MNNIKVEPISGALGAVVYGIDLTRDIKDPAIKAHLDDLFHQYLVLKFPEQDLNPENLLALTHVFGGPGETPYLTGLSDYPDVVPIIKEATEASPHTFGAGWHTDFTFQSKPPARTLLYAVDTPPTGGDTLYCNLYKAYEALSPGMQVMLGRLNAVHSATRSYGPNATLKDHMENMTITNEITEPKTKVHPVIRTHPVTGKKALWVNPVYTIRFEDMSLEESKPLLDYLNSFATNPNFCCRVNWQAGCLTMWDNRCTQHCATSDYHGYRREMLRTTTAGEVPQNR